MSQFYDYADPHKPRNFTINPDNILCDVERIDAIRTMLANDYARAQDRYLVERRQYHITERDNVRESLTNFLRGLR